MGKMVVLANSRKLGGYCMAGKVLDAAGNVGGWIRPVMGAVEEGLPHRHTLCSDGQPATILDVVEQDWGPAAPALHQRENRLMGPAALRHCGRVDWQSLPLLVDDASTGLWFDGQSSGGGVNDRVPSCRLAHLPGSLLLVAVRELFLYRMPGFGSHVRYRADFRLGVRRYNLALTDSVAMGWLSDVQRLVLVEAFVCVSLAVPFHDGFAYKLATAIITKERAENAL